MKSVLYLKLENWNGGKQQSFVRIFMKDTPLRRPIRD